MEIEALRPALRGVAAYKQITDEPLMKLASALLDDLAGGDGPGALEHYTRLFYALHDAGRDGLGAWLHDQLRYRESPYARSVEWEDGDEALAAAGADEGDRPAGVLCGHGRPAPLAVQGTLYL